MPQELQEYQAVFQKFDRDGSEAELFKHVFEDLKQDKQAKLI